MILGLQSAAGLCFESAAEADSYGADMVNRSLTTASPWTGYKVEQREDGSGCWFPRMLSASATVTGTPELFRRLPPAWLLGGAVVVILLLIGRGR